MPAELAAGAPAASATPPLVRVQSVSVAPGAALIDDSLAPGETVGLAGLDGHGQEAFLEILAGLRRPASGRVIVAGATGEQVVDSFRQAVRHGIAYLPRDRRTNGIFPTLSVLDNFGIASLDRQTRLGVIDRARRRREYETWRSRLSIVAPSPHAPISALSGGNQQKVLLARWLARAPRVLLLNDPTRGVDQRTRETLYGVLRDLARAGVALALLSTEIEEVVRLCNRVLVFREQHVAASLGGQRLSYESVIAAMFGRT